MSDLWTEATYDAEADNMAMLVTSARISAAPMWGFLAAAVSPSDFTNRKALVADKLDQIVSNLTPNDPVGFGVVRSSLEAGLDEDFTVVSSERRRQDQETEQRRQAQRRQAAAREEQERGRTNRYQPTSSRTASAEYDKGFAKGKADHAAGKGLGAADSLAEWASASQEFKDGWSAGYEESASKTSSKTGKAVRKVAVGGVKAIVIEPAGNGRAAGTVIREVTINGLDDMQAAVKGYIEAVDLSNNVTMYVNEEGSYQFTNDDVNWVAGDVAGLGGNPSFMLSRPILGPVLLIGFDPESGESVDLPAQGRSWVQRVGREAGARFARRKTAAKTATNALDLATCSTCGGKIVGIADKSVWEHIGGTPVHPDGSVAGDAHGITPLGEIQRGVVTPDNYTQFTGSHKATRKTVGKMIRMSFGDVCTRCLGLHWTPADFACSDEDCCFPADLPCGLCNPDGSLDADWETYKRVLREGDHMVGEPLKYASHKATRKTAAERKVELDPESGQYVGSEWEESEDGTSLVQSASTYGNNPKFATEEEANGWAAEGAETEDTSAAEVEPVEDPEDKKDNPFAEKKNSRRRHAATTFHESYGTVSNAQLAAYRKFNVSPSDHDSLVAVFGEGAHDQITKAVKAFSPSGMFRSFDLDDALDYYDGDLDAAIKDEDGMRRTYRRRATRKTATFFCTTCDVFVGDGNRDTHSGDDHNVEQRKSKDAEASRRTAATRFQDRNGNFWVSDGWGVAVGGPGEGVIPGSHRIYSEDNIGNQRDIYSTDIASGEFTVVATRRTANQTCPTCRQDEATWEPTGKKDEDGEDETALYCSNCDYGIDKIEGSRRTAIEDAGLGVGHIWTAVSCPAYASLEGKDCTCNNKTANNTGCPTCGGSGSVATHAHDGTTDDGYTPCPTCGGSGLVTEAARGRHPFGREAVAPNGMCTGDTDFCPHRGCTTCQGQSYHFKDPNNGTGVTKDNRVWVDFVRQGAENANPYSTQGNPYIPAQAVPGTPDDLLDGPPNPAPVMLDVPMTTRPRQMPSGDSTPESTFERNDQ